MCEARANTRGWRRRTCQGTARSAANLGGWPGGGRWSSLATRTRLWRSLASRMTCADQAAKAVATAQEQFAKVAAAAAEAEAAVQNVR